MKIDIFPHILPRKYFERMLSVAPSGLALQKRMAGIPALVDVELRFRMMDRHAGYVQVLTLANPPSGRLALPSPDLARLANDEMAALVAHIRIAFRIRRVAADEQSRCLAPGDRSRGRTARRDGREVFERQQPAARRSQYRPNFAHGRASPADLVASRAADHCCRLRW
jgi:hypothetical protein